MKRFIIYSVIFLLLFFIIDKGFYFFLCKTPNYEYDKRLELVLEGNINKDLIVLGSSLGSGNILAGLIEEKTGLISYNLSYQGSNIIFHKFILETLLKFNKAPKKVLLAIDSPGEFSKVETLNFRNDRLVPLSKYNYINNELINQNINNGISKFIFLARTEPYHFKFSKKEPPSLNPFTNYGSRPITNKNFFKREKEYGTLNSYSKEDEEDDRLKAFKDIQAICKVNNIDLIFVFSPYYHEFDFEFYKRFESLTLPENNIIVYDTLNSKYRKENNFYDNSHLIYESAKTFTSEIIDFLHKY